MRFLTPLMFPLAAFGRFFSARKPAPVPAAHLEVHRYLSDDQTTLSRVYLMQDGRGTLLCHGLEDQRQPGGKVWGETRIPAGRYRVTLRKEGGFHQRYTIRFPEIHHGMIWVRDVPGFTFILWHVGNDDDDTAGCLLLGEANERAMQVWNSTATYKRVYGLVAPMIEDGRITHVEYVDADQPAVEALAA